MSRILEITTAFAAGGLLIGSIAMWLGGSISAIEAITNLRPHLLVTATVVAIVAIGVHRPSVLLAVGAIAVLLPSTLPYLVAGDVTSDAAAPAISVLQYNTFYLNEDTVAIADEVLDANADVVALHEMTTDRWQEIASLIEVEYPYHVSGLGTSLSESRRFASVLLSRSPLVEADTSSYDFAPVAATTMIHGQEVLAVALHPSPSRTDPALISQRLELLAVTEELTSAHDGPAIIITDLNITPTSPDYHQFIDDLQWPDPRREFGIGSTFPAGPFNPLGIAIDHVFASPDLRVVDYELGDGGGSDHRSLVARVEFSGAASTNS